MRTALIGLACLIAALVAYLIWRSEIRESELHARYRNTGIVDAELDIAHGTPVVRCVIPGKDLRTPQLTAEGLGIDRDTGLPLHNTYYWCGTGRNFKAEKIEDAAYNERIRAAVADGRLDRFRLDHKLRTRGEVAVLFSTGQPVWLAKDGDAIETADQKYTFILTGGNIPLSTEDYGYWGAYIRATDSSPSEIPDVNFVYTPDPSSVQTSDDGYPEWSVWVFPPFEALLSDDDTTVILRDETGGVWVVDLPRAIIVQHIAP